MMAILSVLYLDITLCVFDLCCVPVFASAFCFEIVCHESLNTESLKSSELQKNLPQTDPAAQSMFFSQTAMLIEHHQLNHFSAAIDEVLCHLHQQSSIIQLASPATKTKPSNASITGTPLLAPLVLNTRCVVLEIYDGSPGCCWGFLLQCSICFAQQPQAFVNEEDKVAFTSIYFSLLSGRSQRDQGSSTRPNGRWFMLESWEEDVLAGASGRQVEEEQSLLRLDVYDKLKKLNKTRTGD